MGDFLSVRARLFFDDNRCGKDKRQQTIRTIGLLFEIAALTSLFPSW